MDDDVRIVAAPGTRTAVVAETTTWEAFPALWGELLAEVWAFVRAAGLEAGRNVMLYRDDVPRVEVGVEVIDAFDGTDRVVPSTLPQGRAAFAIARGPLSAARLAAVHAAVRDWCEAEGHALTGARWEVYGHWPEDQDPATYEVEIYWQLEPGTGAPLIDRIDHLVITVRSVDATCAFYEAALGFRRVDAEGRPTALVFGRHKINVHEVGHTFEPKAASPTPGSGDFCLITERPLDEVVDRLERAGVAIELGPVVRTGAEGAMTSVYFRDPDDNLVEVSRY